jgi:uncharacterized protein (TIGR02597 family)
MKQFFASSSIVALTAFCSIWNFSSAQPVLTTEPLGMVNVFCAGAADTPVALSFHRDAEFSGSVQSMTDNVIAVAGSPGWTSNQFVYQAGVQRKTYYVLIQGGEWEGRTCKITSNDGNSVAVDLNGEAVATQVPTGTPVRIIPYHTLASLFPDGQGVHPSLFHGNNRSFVLMFRQTTLGTIGTNKIPEDIYYYYTGTGIKGWRKIGGGLNTLKDDVPIPLYNYLVVRHNENMATQFINVGLSTAQEELVPFRSGNATESHDNYIGIMNAMPMRLSDLRLIESGAFLGSPDHFQQQDLFMVFDETNPMKNKIPEKIYYYYTGTAEPGPGWRLISGGISNIRDDFVINPGSAYVVRKRNAVSNNGELYYFPMQPPYLEP